MRSRLRIPGVALLLAAVAAVWLLLRGGDPHPITTRIPELEAQLEQVEGETEKAVADYQPTTADRIDDLTISAASLLKQLPGVAKVEALLSPEKPTARIVHIADWHFVGRELHDLEAEQ